MMISKNEIKFIKSLKLKKYRVREKLFCVEGRKNIQELINSPLMVRKVFGLEQFITTLAPEFHGETAVVTSKELQDISSLTNTDSGLALVEIPAILDYEYSGGHVLALDGVRDPGNLGTIVRTLDWFGFDEVLCSQDCADFYNPKTIAATMGSFGRVHPHYLDLVSFFQKTNAKIWGLTLNGTDLSSSQLEEGIYVLGSESHGIRAELEPLLTDRLTIARFGEAESLNVAMASGILLHAIRHS